MFGHSDNQQVNNPMQQGQQVPDPAMSPDQMMRDTAPAASQPVASNFGGYAAPSPFAAPVAQPQNPFSMPTAPTQGVAKPDFSASVAPTAPATNANTTLLDIKQKALQELSPLVDQLEQTPEEKFRTTMMMIQASDDQSLLPAAYDAAQAIVDEKAKAQALLDVVNEINYFTQSH
jgi:hypothetical protein